MRHFWLLLFSFLPASGHSETLPVYTGEHGAFTRIVLADPDTGAWSVKQTSNDRITLEIENAGASRPDLEGFFDRIDKSRIREATWDPSVGLVLTLSCDCRYERAGTTGHTIIDIRPVDQNTAIETFAAIGMPETLSPPASLERNLAWSRLAEVLENEDARPFAAQDDGDADGQWVNSNTQSQAQRLIIDFAGALASGAISPGADAVEDRLDLLKHDIAIADTIEPSDDAATCATFQQATDFSDFSGAYIDIAEMRQSMIGLDGAPDPNATLRLAKSYLAMGWGAEARSLLRDAEDSAALHAPLGMIAEIISDPVADQKDLSRYLGCGGAAHLWSLFDPVLEAEFVDEQAARRTFQALPDPLKSLLAPRLAELAREAHLEVLASGLATDLALASTPLPAGGFTAINMQEDFPHRDQLRTLASSRDEDTAFEAVIGLAQMATNEEATALSELSAVLAKERKGTPDEIKARLAEFSALIASGAYDLAARRVLADDEISQEGRSQLLRKAMSAALEDADEARFLEFLFALRDGISSSRNLPQAPLADLVARAIDMGFADELTPLVSALDDPALRVRRVQLEAGIALNAGRFAEAELAALALDPVLGEDIRARARAGMQDFDYLRSRNAGEMNRATAILSESWDRLEAGADPWSRVPELREERIPDADPDLAGIESLLRNSDALRSDLDALLEDTELTEPVSNSVQP